MSRVATQTEGGGGFNPRKKPNLKTRKVRVSVHNVGPSGSEESAALNRPISSPKAELWGGATGRIEASTYVRIGPKRTLYSTLLRITLLMHCTLTDWLAIGRPNSARFEIVFLRTCSSVPGNLRWDSP